MFSVNAGEKVVAFPRFDQLKVDMVEFWY